MLLYRSSGASPGCRRIEVIRDIEFSVAGTVTGADDGIYGGSWGVYTCANQLNFVACDIVGLSGMAWVARMRRYVIPG